MRRHRRWRWSSRTGGTAPSISAHRKLLLAVKTALVTGRPLLLQGAPGSGKSSIAAYVARNLNWRYYEFVVDARTEPSDLLWRFDLVRRLADAQVKGHQIRDVDYVEPGALWWMLDPDSARHRGGDPATRPAVDPRGVENASRDSGGAVLLIDEIDKAEPDVPGSLLVPLGSFRFTVSETGTVVPAGDGEPPVRLVVITTNDDRDLPPAFLRRCVVHRLEPPDDATLAAIAMRHLTADGHDPADLDQQERALIFRLAERVASAPRLAIDNQRTTSVAEYLDAVRALRQLRSTLSDDDLAFIECLVLVDQDDD